MKINQDKMRQIEAAVQTREAMRIVIRTDYSNDVLAQRFGVNVRTIEKLAALCRNVSCGGMP